jgi:hypothetical protein
MAAAWNRARSLLSTTTRIPPRFRRGLPQREHLCVGAEPAADIHNIQFAIRLDPQRHRDRSHLFCNTVRPLRSPVMGCSRLILQNSLIPRPFHQLRQLGDPGGDLSRLSLVMRFAAAGRWRRCRDNPRLSNASSRLRLEINVSHGKVIGVTDDV